MMNASPLEREYHGCRIVSEPNAKRDSRSDGWTHTVYHADGTLLGEFGTLAQAVAASRESEKPQSTTPSAKKGDEQ